MPSNTKQDLITEYRAAIAQINQGFERALACDVQWDALDYGNTLVDGDFAADNQGITKAEFAAAVQIVRDLRTKTAADNNFNAYKTTLYKVHKR